MYPGRRIDLIVFFLGGRCSIIGSIRGPSFPFRIEMEQPAPPGVQLIAISRY